MATTRTAGITVLADGRRFVEKPENPRSPYPLTWQEQDALFCRLPAHLAHMALFAVNTGLRDSNICGLQWQWEVAVPEVGRSVFVIPPEALKTKRPHVVILNDVAWSFIESQRGKPPIRVFPYQQRREHHIGIQHHPWRRLHLRVLRAPRRAQLTASAMSCSCRLSSASLARTASARWMRKGVSTMTPSLVSTSKYSTGPMALVMALGRVNWFLAVILASTIGVCS